MEGIGISRRTKELRRKGGGKERKHEDGLFVLIRRYCTASFARCRSNLDSNKCGQTLNAVKIITHECIRMYPYIQMTSSIELSLFHPSFVEIPRRLRPSLPAILASLNQTESFHWSASTCVSIVVHKATLTNNQSHLTTLTRLLPVKPLHSVI